MGVIIKEQDGNISNTLIFGLIGTLIGVLKYYRKK